jgi:serine protease Do
MIIITVIIQKRDITQGESMKKTSLASVVLLIAILMASCSSPSAAIKQQAADALRSAASSLSGPAKTKQARTAAPAAAPARAEAPVAQQATQAPVVPGNAGELLSAYESTLSSIYDAVNPSVVNIRVLVNGNSASLGGQDTQPGLPFNMPGLPFGFGQPGQQQPSQPSSPDGQQQAPDTGQAPVGEALGSGFVWDKDGHIVTNNHVIADASKIEVTFADGTTVPAKLVGADPDSDLAVLKIDTSAVQVQPVQIADSKLVKVGQLAIAIGNPFGLEGTMTTGIISALGRTMPANESLTSGPSYSIPDIIQTDAPINPGNSGGVLLNDQGQVVGVTFAIESPNRSNAGIGFVIPSSIVERVIPSLISSGSYRHPYLGISGGNLTPALAEAMNLKSTQRGALVGDVVANGPADKAGLQGSNTQATVEGQQVPVGGDVIVAINGETIKSMDDLIAYLSANTSVGDKITMTILRDGKQQDVDVTLGSRPTRSANQAAPSSSNNQNPNNNNNQKPKSSGATAWMGISGGTLTPDLAQAMNLSQDQQGVLIGEVTSGGPAEKAGLQGGSQTVDINGQQVTVGGDIITAIDGQQVTTIEDLVSLLQQYKPGQKVTVTILRDGQQTDVTVTLARKPSN